MMKTITPIGGVPDEQMVAHIVALQKARASGNEADMRAAAKQFERFRTEYYSRGYEEE